MEIETTINDLKMNLEEKISLEEIGGKQFKIRVVEPECNKDAVFLENVKELSNHKEGKTSATILNVLKNDLGVPFGRAFRSNLFVRTLQIGFPLQSLTQIAI